MTQQPRSDAASDDPLDADLDERLALSRAASARVLDEIVAQERVRQDGRFAALRRLRDETERVLAAPTASPRSLRARLAGVLGRGRRARADGEHELRRRYEDAQVRARRALAFAETLAELSRELAAELARLRALLAELAEDERKLDAAIGRLRALGGEAEVRRSAERDEQQRGRLEEHLERATRRAQEHEALREAVHAAEDRLLRLVESERMSLVRVDALRAEVERAARAAGQRLDDIGATLRARATTDDTERVLAELDAALAALFGALDERGDRERAP